jgi:hypothetical protein
MQFQSAEIEDSVYDWLKDNFLAGSNRGSIYDWAKERPPWLAVTENIVQDQIEDGLILNRSLCNWVKEMTARSFSKEDSTIG